MYYVLQDADSEPFAIIDASRYGEAEEAMDSIGGYIVEVFEITEAIKPVPEGMFPFSFNYMVKSKDMSIDYMSGWEAIFGERIDARDEYFIIGQVIARDVEHAKIRAMALVERRPCPLTP